MIAIQPVGLFHTLLGHPVFILTREETDFESMGILLVGRLSKEPLPITAVLENDCNLKYLPNQR